jgi:adenylate kinase family enzyme
VERVVVFGRGGSGKSTISRRLGDVTGIPVIELDTIYWDENLRTLTPEEWSTRQSSVVQADAWILDGDLGPYDVRAPRLCRADTVIVMDTSLARCVWRALRRGRQRVDFWVWVFTWDRTYRPQILNDVQRHAPEANVVRLSSASDIDDWLSSCGRER